MVKGSLFLISVLRGWIVDSKQLAVGSARKWKTADNQQKSENEKRIATIRRSAACLWDCLNARFISFRAGLVSKLVHQRN